MSIPVPDAVQYHEVTWNLGHAKNGTTSLAGARGRVKFEATATAVAYSEATVLPAPVETPVIDGVMTPVDLLENMPGIWNWKVTPSVGVQWVPFHIDVLEPVNLASAATMPGTGPVRVVKGDRGAQGASLSEITQIDDETLRTVIEDPLTGTSKVDTFTLPRGPEGPYGGTEVTDPQVASWLGDDETQAHRVLRELTLPASMLMPVANPPAGFRGLTVLPTPRTLRRASGFEVNETVFDALKPTGGGTYYTAPIASGLGGDGLTPATPRVLYRLLGEVESGSTIVVADGEYTRADTVLLSPQIASFQMVPAPGASPVLTRFERPLSLAWAVESGRIYRTTRSATVGVWDATARTPDGGRVQYERMPDLASITGPGQWSADGSTVYVWARGSVDLAANPDAVRVELGGNYGVRAAQGATVWVEGIQFEATSLSATTGATVVAKDCVVRHRRDSNGIETTDGGHMVSIRCEAAFNGMDGFNYHNTSGPGGEFIEINCHSHHNGLTPGATTNNASTAHEAVTGIRVGGTYDHASGPVIADVNSAQSWNLGVHAGGMGQPVAGAQNHSWRADGASPIGGQGIARMWLDECTSADADYAIRTSNGGEILLHAFGSGSAGHIRPGSDGPVTYYTR